MRIVFLLLLILKFITTCPNVITEKCACQEVHNGVLLDCSNNTGDQIMHLIRTNQALLGLIQSLTLKHTQMSQIPSGLFNGLYIKKLDLSHNSIGNIDQDAFNGMNPVLEELNLSNNRLEKIPSSALSFLPNLLKLDLSNNTITEISENNVLPVLNKLYDLNLGSNNITSIHTSTFQNVKNSVQTINLGHNKLVSVPSSAIRGLKRLESLHLHHNIIEQLDALSFLNLPVLNLLNLAGNRIKELNRQAFLNVPNLRYLYLSSNKIQKLSEYQFQTFEQLEMLDLTNNTITAIPGHCLSDLQHLRQLYLGSNRIETINDHAFANSSIVLLVLSDNRLKTVTADTMNGLTTLQQVSFRNNQIETIGSNAFYDVPSLVMLDLAKNKLTELLPSTFLAQLNMLFVDLSENKLPKTPYSAFNRRVGTVLLKENPLVCVENIHMLQDGVGVNIKDSEDIICNRTTLPMVAKPKLEQRIIPLTKLQIHRNPQSQPIENREVQPVQNLPQRDEETIEQTPQLFSENSEIEPELPLPIERVILPTRDDELQRKMASNRTRIIPPSSSTDPLDNPNRMLPFPIPFLKKGPVMSKARTVEASTTSPGTVYTLPPSVLIEPGSTPKFSTAETSVTRQSQKNQPPESMKSDKIEEFLLTTAQENEASAPSKTQKAFNATTVMIICVGLAVIVLILVITGLCITKHRQLRFENALSDSSAARTSEYISSQYQHNLHEKRRVGRFEESPAWIYNPGSSYCNYYK